MTKWIYSFGDGAAEGSAQDRELLGGKGANLAEMCSMGLPVPPGFTVSSEICSHFFAHDKQFPKGFRGEIETAISKIEKATGKKLGSSENPLLLSVRSGSRVSMPGMMDTVLNLGLNDETVASLAARKDGARFAHDSYRRFIQMYASVVMGIDHDLFEEALETIKDQAGHNSDTDLTSEELIAVVDEYKEIVAQNCDSPFPQDPVEQVWGALSAVFSSWQSRRAETYRKLNNIPDDWGTSASIQAMVFGNRGETSATGVAFTRNPSTGEKKLYGEFLVNAQGEDVVAGLRTPQNLTEEARISAGSNKPSLEKLMPQVFAEFEALAAKLEAHFRDMQDLEFTIEDGKLWMLQTRSGKRTAKAGLRIAVEMVEEGILNKEDAILRIDAGSLNQMLHPTIDPGVHVDVIASGLPASPGAATGEVVFNSDEAEKLRSEGRKTILVRVETNPEDIHGMHAAQGILTARGGMTSHAAVVARGMGKPCVSGAGSIRIDYSAKSFSVAGRRIAKGDIITIDGTTGRVLAGAVEMVQPELSEDFGKIMAWADKVRRMKVRANADTPSDAKAARSFGAEGVGLCRTEHMFFEGDRIKRMREMILANDHEEKTEALNRLLPMQRADFAELFETMAGFPVTIRLLDPPLHEFLPHSEDEIAVVAETMGVEVKKLRRRVQRLQEFNPMLGHRGCRLLISFPEIAEMQARAIFEAVIDVAQKTGKTVVPEIMVPLVSLRNELRAVRRVIEKIAADVKAETGHELEYSIGTMIELPRAAVMAGRIAEESEFFSFGTNDLTQTTFGMSRDDAASFMGTYEDQKIVARDPFVSIDVDGVGELMRMASTAGRVTRNDLKLGICGEHGGDPESVDFCETLNLDYVSCSPFRVPIARLAAAQSAIRHAST